MSFRNRLIICILLVSVVPLSIVSYFSYTKSVKTNEEVMVKYSTRLAQNRLDNFNIAIKGARNALLDLVSSPELNQLLRYIKNGDDYMNSADSEEQYNLANQVNLKARTVYSMDSEILENVLILSRFTRFPVISAGIYETPNIYEQVEKLKGRLLWMLVKGDNGIDQPNYNIYLAAAVLRISDNKVIGEVCVHFNMDYIKRIFGDTNREDGEYSFVLTSDNQIVTYPDQKLQGEYYSNNAILKEVDTKKNGYSVMYDGSEKYIVTFVTSEENGWKLINMIPYKNITKKSFESTITIVYITIISALAAIILSIVLSLSMYRPVSILSKAMNQVDKGSLDVNAGIYTKDEFGMLGDSFNKLMGRIKALITQVEQEQSAKKEAEMSALRAQVNPHFLYNTLNVIKCLAGAKDMDGIEDVTVGLIDLLRISIGNSKDKISIKEEIKHVKSYVKIQKFRIDKEFEFVDNISKDLYNYQIPKFTLQPVVENAILHGFEERMSENVITLNGYLENSKIILEIMDNGKGMSDAKQKSVQKCLDNPGEYRFNKVGIVNVSERIKLQYGLEYGVDIKSYMDEGTKVSITIPAILFEYD